MLEQLDKIDWKSLKHWAGTAEEIPNLIRSLVSDDAQEIKETYTKLSLWFCHQGDVSKAGIASIPFLVEILQLGHLESSAGIMNLLIEMSHGSRWSLNGGWFFTETDQLVNKHVNVYLSHLNHPDTMARFNAIRLLCDSSLFEVDETPLILQGIIDQYDVEPDDFNKAAIVLRIGYLFESSGQYLEAQRSNTTEFIKRIYESDNAEFRLVASFTLPKLLRKQTPQNLVDDLVELVANPPMRVTRDGKHTLPKSPLGNYGGGVNDFALISLWYLDQEARLTALEAAMERTSNVWESLNIAAALMHWTFVANTPAQPSPSVGKRPDGTRGYTYGIYIKHQDISSMSEFQKQVVSTLVNSDKAWTISSNLFEAYGLPNDREEVKKLLEVDQSQ